MHGRCVSRCYRRQLADSPSASQASVPEETWHDPRTEDRRLLVDVDSVSRPVREAAAESREGADGQRDRQIYGHGAHAATVRARTSGETSQKRSPQTPKRPGREPVTVCTAVRSPREPRGNAGGPSRTLEQCSPGLCGGRCAGERKHELEDGAGDDVIVSSRRRGACCRWQMLRRSADMVFPGPGRATEVRARPCSAAFLITFQGLRETQRGTLAMSSDAFGLRVPSASSCGCGRANVRANTGHCGVRVASPACV